MGTLTLLLSVSLLFTNLSCLEGIRRRPCGWIVLLNETLMIGGCLAEPFGNKYSSGNMTYAK